MKLIDKDALIAEIERRIEAHKETLKNCDSSISEMVLKGSMSAYQSLLHFFNTLEVKEVDLEKELDMVIDSLNDDKYEHLSIHQQLSHIAHHFFELGLKTKGE